MNMSLTGMADAGMARSSVEEAELRARHREVEASRKALNGGATISKEQKLRDACEGFEAMFIQKMWEGMRSTLPKDGLITGGRDEKTWQGMYDQELGKSLAKSGGIGLADMMMSQLSRNLQDASEVAAASVARREPMAIEPVPLLPPKKAMDLSPEAAKVAADTATAKPLNSVAGLYGDEAVQPEAPGEPNAAEGATVPSPAGNQTASGTPPVPDAVQSVLNEFATKAGVPPAAQATQTVGTPPPAGSTPVAPTGMQAAVNAAGQIPQTPQAGQVPQAMQTGQAMQAGQVQQTPPPLVSQPAPASTPAEPLRRVRPPRDGMPRVPYRRTNGANAAKAAPGTPETARQANLTTGPNIANTRSNPVETGNAAQQPAASATNLMKEQLS